MINHRPAERREYTIWIICFRFQRVGKSQKRRIDCFQGDMLIGKVLANLDVKILTCWIKSIAAINCFYVEFFGNMAKDDRRVTAGKNQS